MVRYESKEKYPCGYETSLNFTSWFQNVKMEFEPEPCPLHGKECKKDVDEVDS